MIHAITHNLRLTRLRPSVLALVAALVGSACNNPNPLATSELSDPPTALATTDSLPTTDSLAATDIMTPEFASVSYSGIPFGPFGLWNSYTTVSWGPAPFTTSQNYVAAGGIVTFINTARQKRQRLVLAMTGGPSYYYKTNGRFDFGKWKSRMNTYNTATIRNAVAAGVADGTIVGNSVIDEPETSQWGGNITKYTIDQMAGYAKGIFPSLPQGVNHGPNGYYLWRNTERYHRIDYVLNQYNWWITQGNVAAWRDKVLAQARLDGVRPAFSLNILGGGIQNWSTKACPIPLTGGYGPYSPNCRMTADQVRNWGRTLGVAGCALLLWKMDGTFMSKYANQQAFRDVAATLNARARPSCRRA